MKTIAILQSNYIPWKGYFDLIHDVDEFILYDDVQFTKRDWRNRNQIKTANGLLWLTIPVSVSGRFEQSIKSVEVNDSKWAQKHLSSIRHSYSNAPFFKLYEDWIVDLYDQCAKYLFLSQINYQFIAQICDKLNIKTKITWSSEYKLIGDKTEKLVNICKQSGASRYLSGPAAKSYINDALFREAGVDLIYKSYNYPEYQQLYGAFTHNVTILDLLFNCGQNSPAYIWNGKKI